MLQRLNGQHPSTTRRALRLGAIVLSIACVSGVAFVAPLVLSRLEPDSATNAGQAMAATSAPDKAETTPGSRSARGPRFFVLGVWVQPTFLMETWKARGVNTVVQTPEGHDVLKWSKAADAAGLYQIRQASPDLAYDIGNQYLLAWASGDEPSNTRLGVLQYGAVARDPAELAADVAPWRAAAAAAHAFVPIWTNHVGNHIWPSYAQNNALMRDYMAGPESDWLCSDSYQIQEREPFVVQASEGYTSTVQGITLDRQVAWSSGKPVMAFLGTSAFKPNAPVPTPAQFSAIAWSAVIHGASGVLYFPVTLSPFAFDTTPPSLVQALTRFNADIVGIDKILMDETRGGRRPYTVFRSANEGMTPRVGQLPYPFEATEIKSGAGAYRIVLNLSDRPQVLNKPEWGLKAVTFQPYGVLRKAS